jgi:hypothetical protein
MGGWEDGRMGGWERGKEGEREENVLECHCLDRVVLRADEWKHVAIIRRGIIVGPHFSTDDDGLTSKAGKIRWLRSIRAAARKIETGVDGNKVVLQLCFEFQEGEEQARMRSSGHDNPVCSLRISVIMATQKATRGSVGTGEGTVRVSADSTWIVLNHTTIGLLKSWQAEALVGGLGRI